MLDPGPREHAAAGVESRRSAADPVLRHLAEVPDNSAYPNGFRAQWELFLRHVAGETATFPWNLEAARAACSLPRPACRPGASAAGFDLPDLEF